MTDLVRVVTGTLVILSLAATPAFAQQEDVTDHVSVEFDAGFLSEYDDSQMWDHGYDVGVTGLWALSASTSVCARFGISHWSYTAAGVEDALVPDDALLIGKQSTGQIEILALTPMVRYQREKVMGKAGAFVAGGVGLAYVKAFALTEVSYEDLAGSQVDEFELDETDVRASALLGAGLSFSVFSSSWFDVLPTYRVIFADETAEVFAISVGLRVRV